MSIRDLLKQRIDVLECPLCGATVTDAIEFKCVTDKSVSPNKIWICKRHPVHIEPDWGGVIAAIASGMV